MKENGDDFEVLLNHNKPSYGLAVDRINKILYWFENRTSLVMSKLNGAEKKTLVKHLTDPRDIALYEEKGLIFFCDLVGNIYRINSDGTNLFKYHVTSSLLITGLAIDKLENRLYWCDFKYKSIQSTDLNFRNYRILMQKTLYNGSRFLITKNSGIPFSISVLGDQIFWSDVHKRAIFSVDKHSGGNIEYVTGGLDHPRDIHVFRDDVKNGNLIYHTISFNASNNYFLRLSIVVSLSVVM